MSKLLREYAKGDDVDSICMLASLSVKQTRDQKPFLRLELGDSSGRVPAVMWEGFDDEFTRTPPGTILRIKGKMDEYESRPQLRISSVSIPASGSYDPAELLPSTEHDTESMLEELDSIISRISSSSLRRLMEAMFVGTELRETFAKAPAAKRWHQPYLGGLLEHTLIVHSHAMETAERYPEVENDLVSAGALVHDIGKTVEYTWDNYFDTSTEGKLVGHLVIGVEILNDHIRELNSTSGNIVSRELAWHLKHIILSHHGHFEFGSPVLPRTLEALIVHFADDLDSKMSGVMRIYNREQELPGDWTSYINLMERDFFKSPVLLDKTGNNIKKDKTQVKQKTKKPFQGPGFSEQSLFNDE